MAERPNVPTPPAANAQGGSQATPTPAGVDRPTELERVVQWINVRTGFASIARSQMRKVFPDHWSFLLGEIALFCFVVLVVTGTFMTFFYTPDARQVTYTGPYPPLDGQHMSAAFASVLKLSFEVRAGLLFRQAHHWAALIFIGAIAIHLCRIFFTAAFRRPRELNWVIGLALLLMALGEGFTGYSLPDDLLSGTGLRIFDSVVLSVPFIGPWAASLLYGGEFPTPDLISRLFVLHVMLLPGLLIGGIGAHLLLVWIQKHTQYKRPRATEENVLGLPFWPGQVFRSLGLFILTAAVIVLIGGLVQINPVWLYGPYIPYAVASPAQPDWYIGWIEGLLRMGLPIEPTIFGVTIPSIFVPGVLIPGVIVTAMFAWPWIERLVSHDAREHHLLDWWWEQPYRTATGAAFVAGFLIATLAGGNDVLAVFFNVPVEALTHLFQVSIVVVPIVVWFSVRWLARQRLRAGQGDTHSRGGIRLRRTEAGGFEEVPE